MVGLQISAIGGQAGSVYLGSPPEDGLAEGEESLPLMENFIYVLKSLSHKTRYVGVSENVEKRLIEHNKGKCRYTKGRIPWILMYQEKYKTLGEARKREVFLKSGQGREFLDSILA